MSRWLGLLEARFDTRLIDRVPRVWAVTPTGLELYQRVLRVVGEVDETEGDFVNSSADISGPLYVSAPRDFGVAYLGDALIGFKMRYPEIQLAVDFDDRRVDVARENYGFTIRITPGLELGVSGLPASLCSAWWLTALNSWPDNGVFTEMMTACLCRCWLLNRAIAK